MQKNSPKFLAAALIFSILLTACTALQTGGGAKLKIGVIAPLTGDGAAYGTVMTDVIRMVTDDINKAGGVKGQKLELVVENGECNGKAATAAAKKLVEVDKVQVILGGLCSSETKGAATVIETAKVLLVSGGSSAPEISAIGDYVFRTYPSDVGKGRVLAKHAFEKGYKKVGVIVEQTDYALGIEKVFSDTFKELSGKETAVEKFTSDSSDVRTQLTKLKEAKVEALFVDPQTPDKGLLILQQAKELQFEPKLMTQEVLGTDTEALKKVQAQVEGMVTADVVAPDSAEFKKFMEDYKAKYGKDLNFLSIAAGTYDAVMVVKTALDAVGYDGTNLKNHLYTVTNYKGMIGTFSFDSNGDPAGLVHALLMIQDGKPVPYVEGTSAKQDEKKEEPPKTEAKPETKTEGEATTKVEGETNVEVKTEGETKTGY